MRILAVVVSAALCAVLSACNPTTEESPTHTPETSQTPSQSVTEPFVEDVRTNVGWSGTDQELLDFGNLLCDSTGQIGVAGVYSELVASVTSKQEAYNLGYVYGSAVRNLCPEYMTAVEDFLKANGGSAT